MSDKCRYCGKPVVWAVDEKGTRQNLDPKPPVYVYLGDGKCERVKPGDSVLGNPVVHMVSHWSTCPKAAEVRADQARRRA